MIVLLSTLVDILIHCSSHPDLGDNKHMPIAFKAFETTYINMKQVACQDMECD
jgi:hypothetical protein